MTNETIEQRREPRSAEEIFLDLKALAQSEGALHEISALNYRDWVVTIDKKEKRITDDEGYRWSPDRLNKNEIMLLLGLMVQSENDRTYSIISTEGKFAETADRLLREFHDRVNKEAALFDPETMMFVDNPDLIGPMGREAIYYGAEGFYIHQFKRYTRLRYRDDATWLLQNAGLSIRPMLEIAQYMADKVNKQITAIGYLREQGQVFNHGDLTNSLLIAKDDLRKKFGSKADAFLAKFSTPVNSTNSGFTDAFALNGISIAPVIDLGDHLYVSNQYRLFETIYESPFYWMFLDEAYKDTAAEHRGAFLEKTAAHIFRSVFGIENVYENISIKDGSKDTPGEIDVLVVYGEFVLVVQAKSKRVTLKARSGDTEELKKDFEGAIQDPYQQALKCIELIRNGADCFTSDGKEIIFPSFPRMFPVVILSDHIPSSTFLSSALLKCDGTITPVIWDLGALDCVARLLPTPIEMIYYLKCRSEVFGKIISDSEYNFLGYHLQAKLMLSDDTDWMFLDREFASVIDDFMTASDVGLNPERPKGILERVSIPPITEVLAEIKNGDPRIALVVIDIYDFSGVALEHISEAIISLREEIEKTGKAIKAFSIPTATGGITYAVAKNASADAKRAAGAIGAKHKYDNKSDRWYVILDSIETTNPIDGLIPLVWPWRESEDEAKQSKHVAKVFKSTQQAVTKRKKKHEQMSTK